MVISTGSTLNGMLGFKESLVTSKTPDSLHTNISFSASRPPTLLVVSSTAKRSLTGLSYPSRYIKRLMVLLEQQMDYVPLEPSQIEPIIKDYHGSKRATVRETQEKGTME